MGAFAAPSGGELIRILSIMELNRVFTRATTSVPGRKGLMHQAAERVTSCSDAALRRCEAAEAVVQRSHATMAVQPKQSSSTNA